MLAIALASLALAGLTVYLSFRLIRSERREFARREGVLVDQVCHLADKPWGTPPRLIDRGAEAVKRDPEDARIAEIAGRW